MSKKMTQCEELGYKVGDKFEVIFSGYGWTAGDVVKLVRDDGTAATEFEGVTTKNSRYDDNKMFMYIEGEKTSVKPIAAKLKPANQALADAIHQNGGWRHSAKSAAQCKSDMTISFYRDVPDRDGDCWWGDHIYGVDVKVSKLTNNWHHTILSRDEYFTAYPEQVKVEINNETEHKVEVEMKSESEVTIKIGDWHKNGELPPVGVFVDVVGDDLVYGDNESNCEVIAHVENTAVIRMSYGLGCFGSGAIIPARTERDKAIDEMSVCMGIPETGRKFSALLYDAGYRKEAK